MFKKKPTIKNLAPLRSSERRKLIERIALDYKLSIPNHEDETSSDGAQSIGAFRNALLPERCLSGKFTTTVGEASMTVSGTVYVGAYSGEEDRILWLKLEEGVVPTVYTLWQSPSLLPLLHTPELVMQKIRGGADLMTPGLAGGPFPSAATKGAIVAIASAEKPTVPCAVGICEIDVSSLSQVHGLKGHAVRGLHWYGDEIWAWSHGGKPGMAAPDHLAEDLAACKIDQQLGHGDQAAKSGILPPDIAKAADELRAGKENESAAALQPFSTSEIDEMFRGAFLYAIHTAQKKQKQDPNHGISFPIPQSQLVSIIQPFLPRENLSLKKTSWKNAKKFIKSLEKERLVKSKDRNGGETVVQEIHFSHEAVTKFSPYKLPDESQAATQAGKAEAQSTENRPHRSLRLLSLWKPGPELAPLFAAAKRDMKKYYLSAELKPIMTSYVDSGNLAQPGNPRYVSLDPFLANTVFEPSSTTQTSVTRDALMDQILLHCAPHWSILRDETREDSHVRPGHAPTVKIKLETRSGNKKVTKVSGLEAFFVDPHELATELQKTCASSTSVSQLVGSSPKNPVMEVLVQGPQKDAITTALEHRGLSKSWIDVADSSKKKK